MAGAILALPAIGFTAIFAIRRYLNFALAAHMAIGAYAGYAVNVHLHLPIYAAIPCAFAVAGVFGVVTDHVALRSLRDHGALTIAIASIALNLMLEYGVRFFYVNALRSYDLRVVRDWTIGRIRVGPQQFEDLLLAIAIMAALMVLLMFTTLGKAMRAVGDNPTLADIKGIDPERLGRFTN